METSLRYKIGPIFCQYYFCDSSISTNSSNFCGDFFSGNMVEIILFLSLVCQVLLFLIVLRSRAQLVAGHYHRGSLILDHPKKKFFDRPKKTFILGLLGQAGSQPQKNSFLGGLVAGPVDGLGKTKLWGKDRPTP